MKGYEQQIIVNDYNSEFIGSAYCKAISDFDSSKSSFNTHLFNKTKGEISKKYRQKQTKINRSSLVPVDSIMSNVCPPDREYEFKEMLENLSDNAFQVAMIALNPPNELIDIVKKKKTRKSLTLHCIRKYLRLIGWDFLNIELAFQELKSNCV